jgi:hypothetical protein
MQEIEVHNLIKELTDKHILKRNPEEYVDRFVQASVAVYKSSELKKILQRKFFIPNATNYTDEAYFQNASELTVANHIRRSAVSDLKLEAKVNSKSAKDVDVSFRVGLSSVSLEVKCPLEEKRAPFPGTITMQTAGRIPNYQSTYEGMRQQLGLQSSATQFVLGKNKDNREDFLVSASQKFSATSGVEDLNILFVSCGYHHNMDEWHGHWFLERGLFTTAPFHPHRDFANVDIVVLSNLKYRHESARECPAWTLGDVLMLPIVNPHARPSLLDQSVNGGLSVFHHYRKEFNAYARRRIGPNDGHPVQMLIEGALKVTHFVRKRLSREEQMRFFPVTLRE